jgi:hypothetical protein
LNASVGVYEQIKKAFQDLIAPELHAVRGDIRLLDQKIDGLDAHLNRRGCSIKDKSLTDTDSLPAPGIIAAEIADDLEAALEQFTKIAARLK